MHLRPFHQSDIPRISDIIAICDADDPVVQYCHPHMLKYWDAYRRSGTRAILRKMATGGVCWVAETDEGDPWPAAMRDSQGPRPGGFVVGFALWKRVGNSQVAKNWQRPCRDWDRRIDSFLHSLQGSYIDLFHLDPSADPVRHQSVLKTLGRPVDAEIFAEAWEMSALCVAPEYQRRRVGTTLLKWGLDQAAAENVPVFVQASPVGVKLYTSCGFQAFEKILCDDLDLEEPMYYLVWERPDWNGRVFELAKKKAEGTAAGRAA
ncbi:MAG: hypothetical protein M1819_006194 [Sarea resinae]|nr:MAG: hypothetical protein M1819_006194 [Sarea resinae]